jgi:hypothetical protein
MGDRRRQPGGQKDVNWRWCLIGLNAGLALSLFLVVTALALGICVWTQTDSQPEWGPDHPSYDEMGQ